VVYLKRIIAEMREILSDLQDTMLNGRIYGKVVNELAIGWGEMRELRDLSIFQSWMQRII
jgi:hypothetical protein